MRKRSLQTRAQYENNFTIGVISSARSVAMRQ
jgi:hypothetical protein